VIFHFFVFSPLLPTQTPSFSKRLPVRPRGSLGLPCSNQALSPSAMGYFHEGWSLSGGWWGEFGVFEWG
jgi:hypothetical protein